MASIIDLHLDGDGAFPELAGRDDMIHLGDGTAIGMAVLDAGMTSGRASVAFKFTLPDGRPVLAEASWRVLATAVLGIAARYGWPE